MDIWWHDRIFPREFFGLEMELEMEWNCLQTMIMMLDSENIIRMWVHKYCGILTQRNIHHNSKLSSQEKELY